jgi:folylpolyglutamate synthase/dihydropteroate synthase
MISARLKTFLATALIATVAIALTVDGAHAQLAANDTARLLAGMQPPPDSPLLALTKDRAWQEHANHFNSIFAKLKNHQLTRIQTWSRARLTALALQL